MVELRLEEVSFRYPGAEKDTIEPMDLTIGAGEAHALLGGSGAGKTTLLNLLSGLVMPTSGRVLFDGEDVTGLRAAERNIAFVFQFPVLYETMTVMENLCFPLRARGWSVPRSQARAEEIAQELGLQDLLRDRSTQLSLFAKQLLAIGRALVRPDVSLVLLDEPLTAVEPAVKWRLRRTLKTAQKDLGTTMVYVTHDQTEALTFADRVSLMYGGRMVQSGTPQEMYESPAHEYVGHFIGSPGMATLTVDVRDGGVWLAGARVASTAAADGAATLGFRPEWARLQPPQTTGDDQSDVRSFAPCQVTGEHVLGTFNGHAQGLVNIECAGESAVVRAQIGINDASGGGSGANPHLAFDHFVLFRDGLALPDAPGPGFKARDSQGTSA